MFVTAIVAAGGQGQRFGGSVLKQLFLVGGHPILERSVNALLSHPSVDEVIVALPRDLAAAPPAYLRDRPKPLKIVEGGRRRQDSVGNAFRAAAARSDVVVIHDAARPFVTSDLIRRTIEAAAESGAALAAIQARDTVKQVGPPQGGPHEQPETTDTRVGSGFSRTVDRTLDRETIYLAQTPQAFRRQVLAEALAQAEDATDEAELAERAGHRVHLVEGDTRNIKITTQDDLLLAEMIVKLSTTEDGEDTEGQDDRSSVSPVSSVVESFRVGTGYDLHRLVEGRSLVLGGVTIPFDRGLLGHSDADAICHAVTDAVLGAAGAGDIGRLFPDTDPQWKGASSLALLARATQVVRQLGFLIGNVDATVIAERPKLAPYLDAIRENVATALGVLPDRVSVKGKTNEGIGALGRGEAIAVHAVALLKSGIEH